METSISADASKSRGRPRLLDSHYEKTLSQLWGPELSRKTIQDRHYAMRTINALGGMDGRTDRYPRLFPTANTFQWTLLAELGRLGDEDTIRDFADQFEKSNLSIKNTVRRIRAWRTGRTPMADKTTLAMKLADLIDEYRAGTGCEYKLVLEAVEKLKETCERLASEEDDA